MRSTGAQRRIPQPPPALHAGDELLAEYTFARADLEENIERFSWTFSLPQVGQTTGLAEARLKTSSKGIFPFYPQ
jgi:hypothetical protein